MDFFYLGVNHVERAGSLWLQIYNRRILMTNLHNVFRNFDFNNRKWSHNSV